MPFRARPARWSGWIGRLSSIRRLTTPELGVKVSGGNQTFGHRTSVEYMDTLETTPPSNGSKGERTLSASPAAGVPRTARAAIEILKVSATSKPVAVAGAIAGVVRSQSRVEVQAIGAGAINQAVKAIAISRGYVAAGGFDLVCIPSFIDISIDGEERTGIRLLVESR